MVDRTSLHDTLTFVTSVCQLQDVYHGLTDLQSKPAMLIQTS